MTQESHMRELTFLAREIPPEKRNHVEPEDTDVLISFDPNKVLFSSLNPERLVLRLKVEQKPFPKVVADCLYETFPPAFARMALSYLEDLSITVAFHEARRPE